MSDSIPRSALATSGAAPASGGTTLRVQDAGAEVGAVPEQGSSTGSERTLSGWLPAAPGTRGVTDSTIEVGMRDADYAAAAAATNAVTGGDASADAFDFKEGNLAALEAINSVGGIAGRKVVPVTYHYNAANYFSAAGRQQEEQGACATYTEDNHVFAFSGSGTEIMLACAANAKTPWIPTLYHLRLTDQRVRSIWNYYYDPAGITSDRANRALALFLLANDVFGREAKIGLMVEDIPDQVQGAQAMKPALTAAGLNPVVEIRYPDAIESPWSSYVLQLQAAGVTNVVWTVQSSQILPAVFMMQAAENQTYRPSWAFGTDMTISGLLGYNAPPEQLAGVVGMGWQPSPDVADSSPESVHSPTATICDAAARKRNQVVEWARSQCEWLFFLRTALQHTNELSVAGLASGVAAMGEGFGSLMTIGGRTSFADRHDGVTTVRLVVYDRDLERFKYDTGPLPIPN